MRRPRPTFASPFAPLELSPRDADNIELFTRDLLGSFVAQYEAFERARVRDGIDARVWQPVKQRENVRVFVRRKHHHDRDAEELQRTVATHGHSGAVAPSDLPVMLIVGAVQGTLDDVMYGAVNPTVESMRVKTSYVKDHIGDAAVLATLLGATPDDPYHSLVLKWTRNEKSRVLRQFIHDRDFVYLERIGMAHTSTHERVGFRLIHSVHFPQTHELATCVRANVSLCVIYRADPTKHQVHLHVRSVFDARGAAPRPLVVRAAAAMFISAWQITECALRKKLVWHLHKRRKEVAVTKTDTQRETELARTDSVPPACTVCAKPCTTPWRWRIARQRSRQQSSCHTCALCAKPICASCRITKSLSEVNTTTNALEQQSFAFCCQCFRDVLHADAQAIAWQELAESDSSRDCGEIARGRSFTMSSDNGSGTSQQRK